MNRPLSEKQKAALERARAARKANLEKQSYALPPPSEVKLSRYGLPADVVERIRAEARAKVEAELRARAQDGDKRLQRQLLDEEIAHYRREAGLANHLDDLLEITINLPPFTDKLVIDGIQYFQGYTYTVPRRVYNDMMETQARGWDAEDRAGNPNRKYYRSPGQTQNPFGLQRFLSDGSALHRASSINAKTGAAWNTPIDNVIDDAAGMVSHGP